MTRYFEISFQKTLYSLLVLETVVHVLLRDAFHYNFTGFLFTFDTLLHTAFYFSLKDGICLEAVDD